MVYKSEITNHKIHTHVLCVHLSTYSNVADQKLLKTRVQCPQITKLHSHARTHAHTFEHLCEPIEFEAELSQETVFYLQSQNYTTCCCCLNPLCLSVHNISMKRYLSFVCFSTKLDYWLAHTHTLTSMWARYLEFSINDRYQKYIWLHLRNAMCSHCFYNIYNDIVTHKKPSNTDEMAQSNRIYIFIFK